MALGHQWGLRKNLIKEFKLDSGLDNEEADDIMRIT
ncbi:hypothetical protein BSPWISOXPB_4424 [uncultured Gammaproteobacteria bacterium]|nr:hypothetical protein BSPWISOXPB_4424 [uncultured Gammaproteobacteria bacterium]